ncbi:MAG: pre-peptidase C-terminal domain-containing protein [Leptolyngbyaceae cyanobacterium MAG.088]|nr:pre-peptidase C-terminal domain-containing protein [Leptolyngbyaceae cyanobacterium MAG.088]
MANYDIGQITDAGYSVNNFSVTSGAPTDVFEFDVVGTRQLSIYLNDISAGDDADIYLYADSNNNGILDSSDTLLDSSINAFNSNDSIDYTATTGTYFAQVERYAPGSSGTVSYDLEISTNYDVGTLTAAPTSRNNYNLSASDPIDVFEFDVTGNQQIALYLNDISIGDDADLYLYADSNNNGILDSDDVLLDSSLNAFNSNDSIDYTATAGTYFAQVERYAPGSSNDVSYDLDLSVNYDVGTLTAAPTSRNNYNLSTSDPVDVFEFDLTTTDYINVNLHDISVGDDADLRLYQDNGNGILDSDDTLVASSLAASNNDDIINYLGSAGTYFAEVSLYSTDSDNNISYDLDLSATNSGASNLLGTEVIVGDIYSHTPDQFGFIEDANATDTYQFSLGLYEGVDIQLTGLTNDADIRLIQDMNNNGIVDAGEVIDESFFGGSSSENINVELSGDYLLQVYQYSGNTSYTLEFNHYETTYA